MISVYQVFKILLGTIVAAAVLYFLINFSGTYAEIQESTKLIKILNSFDKAVRGVYYSGNILSFNEFGKTKKEINPYLELDGRLSLRANGFAAKFGIPLFMRPAKSLLLYRAEKNLGWWKFYVIEAVPAMHIYFSIQNVSLAREVLKVLPSSLGFEPKVYYAFCDGFNVIENPCEGRPCEKEFFEDILFTTQDCKANVDMAVTVKDECFGFSGNGFCVDHQRICNKSGCEKYEDMFDVVAILIAGDVKTKFGESLREILKKHWRQIFKEQIKLAANITIKRMENISKFIQEAYDKGELSNESTDYACIKRYDNFVSSLKGILNVNNIGKILNQSKEASRKFRQVVENGC